MVKKHTPRLRSANEFSKGILDLRKTLELAKSSMGDKDALIESLRQEYFLNNAGRHKKDPHRRRAEQNKLANNVIIGLANYELLDKNPYLLTAYAEQLLATLTDSDLYESFAKHLLKNLDGVEMLDTIRGMSLRKENINKGTLAKQLGKDGFKTFQDKTISLSTTDHLKFLNWLRLAKILPIRGYEINQDIYEKILGIAPSIASEIRCLNHTQKAFLITLYELTRSGLDAEFAKDVVSLCTQQNGDIFDGISDKLAEKLFKPLEASGWVEIGRKGHGRGGKSGIIKATMKLRNIDPSLFGLEQQDNIPSDLKQWLNKSIDEIYTDLDSTHTYTKGIALELLAYRLTTAIGLKLDSFRAMSNSTGGAEVDLICDGLNLFHSRWLVQCKNTPVVTISALAKEIGMATLLKANVILMISTGEFTSTVKQQATLLSETTNFQAILIDGKVLANFRTEGLGYILNHLNTTAKETMRVKRVQVTDDLVSG